MQLTLLFFIFLSIVIIFGGSYNYYQKGQQVSAGIFFLGTIGIAVFFGLRWFTASGEGASAEEGRAWPPIVNFCPDFLTLHKDGNTFICVDTIGVSKNNTLVRTQPGSTPSADNQKFSLQMSLSGDERSAALCKDCSDKGLTWEGVYNGSVCLNIDPPKPK